MWSVVIASLQKVNLPVINFVNQAMFLVDSS
jgi:hypothetical protein